MLRALSASECALVLLDAAGVVAQVSDGAALLLGARATELTGAAELTWWRGLAGDVPVRAQSLRAAAPKGADLLAVLADGAMEADVEVYTLDGRALTLRVAGRSLTPGGAVLSCSDVTAERAADREARDLITAQRAVISASPDIIYRLALQPPRVEWINTVGGTVLGLPGADGLEPQAGADVADVGALTLNVEDAPGVQRALLALQAAPIGALVECTYRQWQEPGWRWVHTRSSVVELAADGSPLRAVGIAQDLTETITAMDALAASERRFHEIFARGPVGMLLYGLDGWVSEVNDALCAFLQRDREELLGCAFDTIFTPPAGAELSGLVAGTVEVIQAEQRLDRADGSVVWAQLSISLTTTVEGTPAFLAFVEDNTARHREAETLTHAAEHDPLTGLPNRRGGEQLMQAALTQAAQNASSVALLYIDLDHFKQVNDNFGHQVGDELLREVAHRLRLLLRAGDHAARLGGDEFVVVCANVRDRRAVSVIASRIGRSLTFDLLGEHGGISVTASIGAVLSEGSIAQEDLLRQADAAMYQAKADGRACWRLADGCP